jgi:hypothetical protein
MTILATGTFEVKLAALNVSDIAAQEKLGRMSIDKVFSGDVVGTSKGEMISFVTDTKGSAGYVAMERVTGSVQGRRAALCCNTAARCIAARQRNRFKSYRIAVLMGSPA